MQLPVGEFLYGLDPLQQLEAEQVGTLGRDLGDLPKAFRLQDAETRCVQTGERLEEGRITRGDIPDHPEIQLDGT